MLTDIKQANSYLQNRKNDEASYEKMLKLRRDLSRAVTILEMIKRRLTNLGDVPKVTVLVKTLLNQHSPSYATSTIFVFV